jgi:hypothetical protein
MVQVAANPRAVCVARGRRNDRSANCVVVMMSGVGADAGKVVTGD